MVLAANGVATCDAHFLPDFIDLSHLAGTKSSSSGIKDGLKPTVELLNLAIGN